MIADFQTYITERYLALETDLLEGTKKSLSRDENKEKCLVEWRKAIARACEKQETPCSYISISYLNSLQQIQIDFYDAEWVYGQAFSRSRMSADFLLTKWREFKEAALDDSFFLRSKITTCEIKSLFWSTFDKLTFLFACYAKYFAENLKHTDEYEALIKADKFYVTCGTYLDWQNRLVAQLPEIDLLNLDANEDTTFREFKDKIYHQENFNDLNLQGVTFENCRFYECNLTKLILADTKFHRCRFKTTLFNEVKLAGARFEKCDLYECEFKDSDANPNVMTTGEYFASLKFLNCKIVNNVTANCDFEVQNV